MHMHTLKTYPHPHNHITTLSVRGSPAEAHTDREKLTALMDTPSGGGVGAELGRGGEEGMKQAEGLPHQSRWNTRALEMIV